MSASSEGWRGSWSDRLLIGGLLLAALGVCASVPVMYAAYAVSALGAVLAPGDRWRAIVPLLVGWPWAVALSVWMCVTTWISPFDVRFDAPGFTYTWPAIAVWGLAVARLRRLDHLLWSLVAGGVLALALAIAQFVIGFSVAARPLRIDPQGVRLVHATGFYSHWIRFGDAMAVWGSWLTALALGLPLAGWRRWLIAIAAMCAAAVGVAVSSARGAVLALSAGVWGALAGGGLRRACIGVGLAGLLFATLLGSLWIQQPGRVANVAQGQDGRTYIWQAAWQVIRQHPLTGVGNGAYNPAAVAVVDAGLAPRGSERVEMGNAHSSYLSLLVLHGIPGLVLWVVWLATVTFAAWRRRGAHPAVWPVALATVLVVLVGGLTEDLAAYASSRFQLFFGLALALGLAQRSTGPAAAPSTER